VLESELALGESPASAYRSALVGILTSKSFFYLKEGSLDEYREQIDDWELASRLSYLLWGSMPDDALFAAAAEGKLRDPQVIRAQLARMLTDEKIERLHRRLPATVARSHRVGAVAPDRRLYPDYDTWLERSMVLETKAYFQAMLRENRSLREFLISDWTIVNERLARHYGLPVPGGQGFQKVKLRPEDHRGGLLTHASILSLTSDGSRHRPVHRGVWVSEAIFGRTFASASECRSARTHAPQRTEGDDPSATRPTPRMPCAAFRHRTIDPLGFAFDHLMPSAWRGGRVDGGGGANPPVNASGVLSDGRASGGRIRPPRGGPRSLRRGVRRSTGHIAPVAP
jgi:hypothetical protein